MRPATGAGGSPQAQQVLVQQTIAAAHEAEQATLALSQAEAELQSIRDDNERFRAVHEAEQTAPALSQADAELQRIRNDNERFFAARAREASSDASSSQPSANTADHALDRLAMELGGRLIAPALQAAVENEAQAEVAPRTAAASGGSHVPSARAGDAPQQRAPSPSRRPRTLQGYFFGR